MSISIDRPPWADVPTSASRAGNADEQLVLDLMSALSSRDAEGLRPFFTYDVMYQNMPLPPAKGIDAVSALLGMLLSVISIDHIETFYLASDGGFVLTERIDRLTAKATGKTVDLPVAGVLQVRDGRIAAWRDYFDLVTFEEVTGFSLRS